MRARMHVERRGGAYQHQKASNEAQKNTHTRSCTKHKYIKKKTLHTIPVQTWANTHTPTCVHRASWRKPWHHQRTMGYKTSTSRSTKQNQMQDTSTISTISTTTTSSGGGSNSSSRETDKTRSLESGTQHSYCSSTTAAAAAVTLDKNVRKATNTYQLPHYTWYGCCIYTINNMRVYSKQER